MAGREITVENAEKKYDVETYKRQKVMHDIRTISLPKGMLKKLEIIAKEQKCSVNKYIQNVLYADYKEYFESRKKSLAKSFISTKTDIALTDRILQSEYIVYAIKATDTFKKGGEVFNIAAINDKEEILIDILFTPYIPLTWEKNELSGDANPQDVIAQPELDDADIATIKAIFSLPDIPRITYYKTRTWEFFDQWGLYDDEELNINLEAKFSPQNMLGNMMGSKLNSRPYNDNNYLSLPYIMQMLHLPCNTGTALDEAKTILSLYKGITQ